MTLRGTRLVVSAVLTALCAGFALSGCGIPPQEEPTIIEPSAVPFGLAEPRPRTPALSDARELSPAFVYFVTGDRLTGVFRSLQGGDVRGRVRAVLRALADGPTVAERRAGLSSAVPPGLRLRLTGLNDDTVTIDLSGDTGPSAEESPLTAAQLVLSLTSLTDVERVSLTREHQPIDAPLVDGSLTSAPLTAADYRPLELAPDIRPGDDDRSDRSEPYEERPRPRQPDDPDDGVDSGAATSTLDGGALDGTRPVGDR